MCVREETSLDQHYILQKNVCAFLKFDLIVQNLKPYNLCHRLLLLYLKYFIGVMKLLVSVSEP
jgi:hypothetical protein